jgi:hypothetical protein
MIYPHVVTFQSPSFTTQPSGQRVADWEDVTDLTDLPARVVPVPIGEGEQQTDRMLMAQERYTIVVQGDREVGREMRAVADHLAEPLGVIRVQRPTLYGSALTNTTLVEAERIAAGLPEVGSS